VRAWFHMCDFPNAAKQIALFRDSIIWFECPGSLSQIGKKVRGMSKTHVYCNVAYAFGFACHAYRISAVGVAGTHSQLCIADYKYRYAAWKLCNWLAHQACTHTYLANFHLKKVLARTAVVRQLALAQHENILAPGIRATDFSGPGLTNMWIKIGISMAEFLPETAFV